LHLTASWLQVLIVAVALWALVRLAEARIWHVALAAIAGAVLSSTPVGPQVSDVLGTLTGGWLH
jgi:hypothetical protein